MVKKKKKNQNHRKFLLRQNPCKPHFLQVKGGSLVQDKLKMMIYLVFYRPAVPAVLQTQKVQSSGSTR